MRWIVGLAILAACAICVRGQSASEQQKAEIEYSEQMLKRDGLKTDAASLLGLFQSRTPSREKQQQLALLIAKLGDESYRNRARATHQLLKAGPQALPFLKLGLDDDDMEIVRRAEICLEPIVHAEEAFAPQLIAAAQLLAYRKPTGAAKTFLDVLPFIADPSAAEQIRTSLAEVAGRKGKPLPALMKALDDKYVIRRAAAGEALARIASKKNAVVLKLLEDPEPKVRLHVAIALLQKEEPAAIPTLISLIDKMPLDKAWQAEEMLHRVAGESAPQINLNANTSAAKVRQAWQQWWQKNQAQAPALLAKLTNAPPSLGYTLISQMTPNAGTNGQVQEIDSRGRVRWKIDGLKYPVDAQVVGRNRVLITEYLERRVSERDFQGKIFWSKQVSLPTGCQRLRNGNTLIVARRLLVEVDRNGKEVFTYRPKTNISAAYKGRNGEIAMITSSSQCIMLNAKGEERQAFRAGPVYTMGGNIEILPNGRLLVPEYSKNRVVEYTPEGKVFWTKEIRYPTSAVRLANGNTLIVSMTNQNVVEVNHNGRVVWEHRTNGRPWRARRR